MKKNKYNKLRKDKINTAVYLAMKQVVNHPCVANLMNDAVWLKPHRKGFDMDYMTTEHRLSRYFTDGWSARVKQLKEKFGEEKAEEIEQRMRKVFSCKGLVYNSKNQCQCHHPYCPICYHRKLYKLIKDLKPYMSQGSSIHVLSINALASPGGIGIVFDGLEARAKKFTHEIDSFAEQWIRIPHLAWNEEEKCFAVSCLFIIAPTEKALFSGVIPAYKKYADEIGLQITDRLEASLDSMPELLTEYLYYDPLVLRNGGSRALEEWDRKTPWFRYRAKHAHR